MNLLGVMRILIVVELCSSVRKLNAGGAFTGFPNEAVRFLPAVAIGT